jgi:hypothetical protein
MVLVIRVLAKLNIVLEGIQMKGVVDVSDPLIYILPQNH